MMLGGMVPDTCPYEWGAWRSVLSEIMAMERAIDYSHSERLDEWTALFLGGKVQKIMCGRLLNAVGWSPRLASFWG